jgi:hypothetical protein
MHTHNEGVSHNRDHEEREIEIERDTSISARRATMRSSSTVSSIGIGAAPPTSVSPL